jgi:hypothetical protein
MILSIHQPSYFPWLGLLDKIRKCDVFVVMDEVQLSDSAYQHRNLFSTVDGQVKFLTIPFSKKNYLRRPIAEIEIASADWRKKHFNFLCNAYRKHPYAGEMLPILEHFYAVNYRLLADAVLASMSISFDLFGIEAQVVRQSSMAYDRTLRRADLVIALVRASGANCYLSGPGARSYLNESAFPDDVELRYNQFQHPVYPQQGASEFHEGLACLDVLFNLGKEGARALLRENATSFSHA